MLAAFAQFERALIRERQREGIELAKAKGVYKGRKPTLTAEQIGQLKARVEAGEFLGDHHSETLGFGLALEGVNSFGNRIVVAEFLFQHIFQPVVSIHDGFLCNIASCAVSSRSECGDDGGGDGIQIHNGCSIQKR